MGIFSERLEAMIAAALQDGVLTDKERELLKKRVEKEGEDWDEVEMIIEARLAKKQPATGAVVKAAEEVAEKATVEKVAPANQPANVAFENKINDIAYKVVISESPFLDRAALCEALVIDYNNADKLLSGGLPCTVMKGISKIKAEYVKRILESCGFVANVEEAKDVAVDDTIPIVYRRDKQDKNKSSIVVPEGVTELENRAFSNFQIESISLPSTLHLLNERAFGYCEQLESIIIPEGVETIPNFCFNGCNCLSNVVLPSSINRIDAMAFSFCSSLKSITIPMGCRRIKIAGDAFLCSRKLNSIFLPPTLSSIRIVGGLKSIHNIYCFSPSIEELDSIDADFYVLPQFLEAYRAQAKAEQVTDKLKILSIPDEYLYYYDN